MGRHLSKALLLLELRRYREAIDALNAELADDPYSAGAFALRAACFLQLNRPYDAHEDVINALRLAPDFSYAHYILSYVRQSQGRADLADDAIREAIRLEPQADYFCRFAELLFYANRVSDCHEVLQQSLSLDPSHLPSLLFHGRILTRLGRYGEAKESFLQALSVNPEQPNAHRALGAVTLQIGQPSEARDALREARRLSPIMHNDPRALAVAYGRLLWPFSLIDRILIRFPSWRPWARWSVVTLLAAAMMLVGLTVDGHELIKAVLFAVVLNALLGPTTFDMAAHATGKIAYRRDLDISWPELLPELFRFAFPVLCHLFITWLAVICAYSPAVSLFIFSMLPHVELVPIFFRQLNNGEPSDGGLVFVGIAVPMACSYYAWFIEKSFGGLVGFWLVSLMFSFLLTVHYRSSAIRI